MLQTEIDRLRKQHNLSNQEDNRDTTTPLNPQKVLEKTRSVDQLVLESTDRPVRVVRRSSSILMRAESGKVHSLREIFEGLNPRAYSSPNPGAASEWRPSITMSDQMQRDEANNQIQHDSAFESFAGYEDRSLGELFKYAIVLAGPTPAKSKKSAFESISQRLKAADFRRTRSVPEGPQHPSPKLPPSSTPRAAGDVASLAQPGSGSLTDDESIQQPRMLVDFIPEEPAIGTPSIVKKNGWFARLRSATGSGISLPTSPSSIPIDAPLTLSPQAEVNAPARPPSAASKLLGVFPTSTPEIPELEGLVELCFPYGDRIPQTDDFSIAHLKRTLQERHRTYRCADSTFVLTIASASNPTEITYAICVNCPLFPNEEPAVKTDGMSLSRATSSIQKKGASDAQQSSLSHCCLCLLSPYPFFGLFFKVLFGIATLWDTRRREQAQENALAIKDKRALPPQLTIKDFISHFETIMGRLQQLRVPSVGGWSRMVLAPELTHLAFHRPHSESVSMERRMLLLEYAAPMLFALLSVDQVLFLLGCLCCEHKVLVVSDHVNIVSSCVLALTTLLDPLQWAGPVITVLPPRLDELLDAPVPLIAGRVSIGSANIPNFSTLTSPMKGVIEMNMDQNNLCMHEDDLMNYHELKLPGCDALVHELQYFSAQVFENHLDPDFPSVQQTEACEIMCTRIHRHIESICAFASGESSTLEIPSISPTPARDAGLAGAPPPGRRCSEQVSEYIQRFQETQMFSMLTAQRQDGTDGMTEDEVDDDEADDKDDDDDDCNADVRDTEQLFADEAITYTTYPH